MSIFDDFKVQAQSYLARETRMRLLHDQAHSLAQKFGEPGPDMATAEDFTIAHTECDIPARLYTPFGAESLSPCHVFFHGGGFVVGSIDTHDALCRRLALSSGHKVLSVDYRLAPGYPYPAGPDDCERALLFALERGLEKKIDGRNITVGGDSAGGNMAAYLAQKYRRRLRGQVLLYPLMQLREKTPHKPGWQDSLMLGYAALSFIEKAYVAGADVNEPRISPLFEVNLAGLPRAFVLTCDLDPLRAEGKAYADKLAAAGVSAQYHHIKNVPHGFLNFTKTFPAGRKAATDAGEFIRKACAAS